MRSAVWGGVDYDVTQPYDPAVHTGIDIGCPSGTTIYAARAGVVERVQTGMTSVRVFAQRDFYLHGTSLVAVGQHVAEGQAVARSGAVQVDPRYIVTGPHLHFEVQNGYTLPGAPPTYPEAPLDPVPFLITALTYGAAATSLEENVNPYLLAHLMYLAGLGHPYTTKSDGSIDAQWLVDRIKANPDDVGGTLGAVLNSDEGRAWAARQAVIRGYTADQLAAALKGVAPADDDSAYATKADVDALAAKIPTKVAVSATLS